MGDSTALAARSRVLEALSAAALGILSTRISCIFPASLRGDRHSRSPWPVMVGAIGRPALHCTIETIKGIWET